jgi:mono/diheme cytochrome c family protein
MAWAVALSILLAGAPAQAAGDAYAERVAPFLAEHCFACHGPEKQKGRLDFRDYPDADHALRALDVFEEVERRLADGIMPPEERPRPPESEIAEVLSWIDAALAEEARATAGDPGNARLRRLSRFEYRNTVRDLFGVDFDATDAFPSDEVALGFENVGDVQTFSPLLLEKYLAAAEEIAARALDPWRGPRSTRVEAADLETIDRDREFPVHGDARMLYTEGAVGSHFAIPSAGEYAVRVSAGAEQAGGELARLAVRARGKVLGNFEVHAEVPAREVFETSVALESGEARIAAAFENDYYEPAAADEGERDRNLAVEWIEVEGPLGGTAPRGPLAELLPPALAGNTDDLRGPLGALLERTWRRPPSPEEVGALLALSSPDAPALERLERAIAAMLVSPHFLLRVELDPVPDDPTPHALSPHELATRLSYFLWSSTPDARLLALADAGTLGDGEVLSAEIERMLSDARASALVEGFFVPWLGLRKIEQVTPDRERFPEFDASLRSAMREETELFLEAILREDRPVRELLDADYGFVNERLAAHYGLPAVPGERMRRVPLHGSGRGGLLTQASILTLTSNPTRTSPVKRGKWILETLLGTPPDPPPPGVGVLADDPAAERETSMRERLALHRAKPECAACHASLDPLGLALEHYGPTGRWRDQDAGHAIDSSAELPDGRRFEGAEELAALLLQGDRFERALVERLLVYALGRDLTRADRSTTARILDDAAGSPLTLHRILASIARSDAFRTRRGAVSALR